MAFLLTSAPTTDRSSWPRPCRNGSRLPAPRPLTSSGAVLGRTATSRVSTRAFATSCSTAKSSTRSERPELSSRAGGATTTRSGRTPHLDTSHQHRSVRARLRRVAACATPSGSGHAGETANLKLTFHLDHSAGADHQRQESLIVPPAVL